MGRQIFVEKSQAKGERHGNDSQPQTRVVSEDSKTIFVGNLDFSTVEDTLTSFFESCGKITNTRIAKRDGQSRGFGHVEFATKEAV